MSKRGAIIFENDDITSEKSKNTTNIAQETHTYQVVEVY